MTMDHLAIKMKGPLKIFMDRFGEFVREDDYQQFFSNRRQNGRDTYLSSDFRRADKLSSVILEEYGVRNKLGGNVIFVIPDPAWDVPFYMFQLGGNGKQIITRSTPARLYQERSNRTISPLVGRCCT